MRRGRSFLFLLLILIVGAGVLLLVYQRFMQPASATGQVVVPTAAPVLTENVVVVTQHVRRGETLSEDVLQLVPYQKDILVEGMITNAADVVGKRAKIDLEQGYPLTQNMVTGEVTDISASGSDAALMIPRGMVAVSIPTSRLNSVAFAPERGDHVNILVTLLVVDLDTDFQSRLPNLTSGLIAPGNTLLGAVAAQEGTQVITMQNTEGNAALGRVYTDPGFDSPFYILPSEEQRPRLVSQTLIQDVIVLQMGNFSKEEQTQTSAASGAQSPEATPTPGPNPETQATATPEPELPPDVVTLIVTPQDAVTLNYLVYSGAKISLALRGANDDTRAQTEAVTLQFLLDQYKIPVPVKLPVGLEPRINAVLDPVLPNDAVSTPQP